jgi:hypothetical protein
MKMNQERIAAETVLIAQGNEKIQNARRMLLLTSDHGHVSSVCQLHMEIVQYLACEPIANQVLTQVDLSGVSEYFRFDDDYLRLITKYFFAFSPPVISGLNCCHTSEMFVHAFALALVVPIPRDIRPEHRHAQPFPSFTLEFLQLPFGVTFAYVMADVHTIISRYTTAAWTDWSYPLHGLLRIISRGRYRPPLRFHFETQTIIHIAPALPKSTTDDRIRKNRRAMNIIKLKLGVMKNAMSTMQSSLKCLKSTCSTYLTSLAQLRSQANIVQEMLLTRAQNSIDPSNRYPLLSILLDRAQGSRGKLTDPISLGASFVVHTYSYNGYEFLRKFLPFPSRKTIDRCFVPRIRKFEQRLTDASRIRLIVKRYGRPDAKSQIGTLAVDAISLDNKFLSNTITVAGLPSHAFVFEFLPFCINQKCFPLNIMPSLSGSANQHPKDRIQDIVKTLRNLDPPVHIWFIATDGDAGYNALYKSQFTKWFTLYESSGLDHCLNKLPEIFPLYVADFLHVVKNIRSRMIKYFTGMRWGGNIIQFRSENIDSVLGLGPILSDRSSTGKMRDGYPIALFRLEYVLTLINSNCGAEALYILPWALIFRVLLSSVVSRATRISVLRLALRFLTAFYKDACDPDNPIQEQIPVPRQRPQPNPDLIPMSCPPSKQGTEGSQSIPAQRPHPQPNPRTATSQQIPVRPFKVITLLRCMNAVIALIYALVAVDVDLPLDRISTHPLENFFGLLRRILHDCNTFDELLHAAARNTVVDEVFQQLDVRRDICGRENTAGIVSTADDKNCHEIDFDVDEIFNAITVLVNSSITHAPDRDPVAQLGLDWLSEMNRITMTSHVAKGSRVVVRGASASKIMAHNLWSNQRISR